MREPEPSEVDEREQLKQKLLSGIVKVDGPLERKVSSWSRRITTMLQA
jgi:hypothetical protein